MCKDCIRLKRGVCRLDLKPCKGNCPLHKTREEVKGLSLNTDKVLTPAETRIAAGYSCGFIAKEIAVKCGVSVNTVVHHTQNIYDKTGIRRSTNSLVSWFLSKNYNIDLRELSRRIGAFLLFLLTSFQIATTDFDSQFVRRAPTRRVEARRSSRRKREDEDNTIPLC